MKTLQELNKLRILKTIQEHLENELTKFRMHGANVIS